MINIPDPQLVLASASPRRRELLDQVGLRYRVAPAEVDEMMFPGEAATDYVLRIAAEKARQAASADTSGLPVLAADTSVVLDGVILGKPGDALHAADMLRRLSGRSHEVLTAVVLLLGDGTEFSELGVSRVTFAGLESGWINAYCATGEPLDKAGAYAIQGFAAQRISRIEGSYSGVMGLPLFETVQLLKKAGIQVPLNTDGTG